MFKSSRVFPLIEIPKKLQEYPNAREGKVRLAIHHHLIQDTQTMLEGPPPLIPRVLISKKPQLEVISEVDSSREKDESMHNSFILDKPSMQNLTNMEFLKKVLDLNEQIVREMWEAGNKHATKNCSDTNVSSPFSKMDLDWTNTSNQERKFEARTSSIIKLLA